MNDKHTFLKHAKHLEEVSLRYDNDLPRLQQKERQDMSANFDTLKSQAFVQRIFVEVPPRLQDMHMQEAWSN